MEDCVQKYQKVYNFLKRVLSQERYEGIRLVEPCVVVAQGFNKVFKYAVLGDEMLYITENPPKSSKDINMALDLSTITSVDVIHDYPEFLNGDLKSKAQHIVVLHKKQQSKESNSSFVKLAWNASMLGTSPVMSSESLHEVEKGVSLTPSPRRTSYLEVSGTLSEHVRHMRLSVSESDIKTRVETRRQDENSRFESRRRAMSHRPLPVPPSGYQSEDYTNHRIQSNTQKPTSSKRKRNRLKQRHKEENSGSNVELNSSSSSVEFEYFSGLSCMGTNDSTAVQRLPSPPCSPDSPINQMLPPSDFLKRSSPCPVPNLNESQVDFKQFKGSSTESSEYMLSLSDESGSDESNSSQNMNNLTEIHLYVLTEHSLMFMHLRSTWNNCILKSTLLIESRKSSLTPAAASSTRIQYSKVDNSQMLQLFYQLKSEILQSQHMEKSFVLIQELLTAAQKSFALKKFFWKSPDLFTFIVGQLHLYLPHSPSSNVKERKLNRADELDFVVVLLEVLTCMFRETEVLIPRLNVLKSNKAQTVRDLVRTIVKTPKVKKDEESGGISRAAQMLLMDDDHQVQYPQKENEMIKLLEEIMDGTSSVMHELILAVHQAKCFASDDNVLNIYWLMKILEAQETGLSFLERMMQRAMVLVQCTSKWLTPREAVLLFRQFYVMQNVLQYSDSLAQSVRTAYAEEFRYYIKQHIVRKKLSSKYPVTGPLLLAVEKVCDLVLSPSKSKSFRK